MDINLSRGDFYQVIKREVRRKDYNNHETPETSEILGSYASLEHANRHVDAEARKIARYEGAPRLVSRIGDLYTVEISISDGF